MFFGLFRKKKPPVVTHRVVIAVKYCLSEKEFRKHIKKVLSWITKEEMEALVLHIKDSGRKMIRVPENVLNKLEIPGKLTTRHARRLTEDIYDSCRCGDEICCGCAKEVVETMRFRRTNMGIIQEENFTEVEFDSDGDALVHQFKEVM